MKKDLVNASTTLNLLTKITYNVDGQRKLSIRNSVDREKKKTVIVKIRVIHYLLCEKFEMKGKIHQDNYNV